MNLNSSLRKTPIAVIGLSAIFADAKNVEEYWTNIIQAKDSIKEVPANRWLIEDYYDPDMNAPDKTYCKRGGFLPEIDFNPMEFGLPPNILEVTDASQLLGLVAARDALEDAGYGRKSTKFTAPLKEKTGVLLGVGGGQKLITPLIARLQYPIWERALRASGIAETDIPRIIDKMKKAYVGWNENAFPGLLGNVISGRITNRFDLGGINSVVDAACAASLSAVKMALSELIEGRADMMLTGGVDTDNSPFMYMSFSKTPAFSKSGNISPFSAKADGMLIGEGIGMLVLKRLSDAEKDGDRIYSVITGVGASSDGRFKSVYAPRPSGQALAMNRAYEDAGYAPSTVGLLEAHGTGTGAGDPTEFTSMNMVFGADKSTAKRTALGSVKSQIGHTKSAAGAAGMIKAVLALHHKVLPATINVEQPNPKFDIDNSPIYINTETRPWFKDQHPRRAGVSAFGFGGINVHVAMQEYVGKQPQNYRLHEPYKTVLLDANNSNVLLGKCQSILTELRSSSAENVFNQLIQQNNTSPSSTDARIGFVTKDIEECIAFLEICVQNLSSDNKAWSHPKGIYYRPNGIDPSQKIVALFSGQGSQYVGMGKEILNAFPAVRTAFDITDTLFKANNEPALSKTIFPVPVFSEEKRKQQQQALTATQNAQPAIGSFSMGCYQIFKKAGFKADFTAGHSFGELTALWAAGAYDDATFLKLAKKRGDAMASQNPSADAGTMLAVKGELSKIEEAIASLQNIRIANINSKNQVVLGGSTSAIATAENHLKNQGFKVVPLPVSAAFHTEFVKHAQVPFANFVQTQNFNTPQIPVYSNTTGQPYPQDVNQLKSVLQNQILNPVYFSNQIENIHSVGGRVFVEFGPKGILTNLVKNILKGKDFHAVAINASHKKDSDLQFRQAVVELQVLGLPIANIDPYKRSQPELPAITKLNVKLSGNNYVAANTKKAYDEVMNDGFKISGVKVPVIANNSTPIFTNILNEEEEMNKETLQLLKSTLESFKANQIKSLEIFEKFMSAQDSQSNQLLQILTSQIDNTNGGSTTLATKQNGINKVHQTIPTTTPAFGNTNGKTNGYSNGQNGTSTSPTTRIAPAVATSTIVAPTPVINNGKIDTSNLEKILLEVVSEKTGYPAEMLELSMDMEADLGIDSIKRVEIFGALTKQYPEMSGINPNELTELRTLGEIVTHVAPKSGTISNNTNTNSPQVAAVAPVAKVVATPSTSGIDTSNLEKILLEVVSEKTGYPAEMLELSMDMEADLGIDSIKRVEIFGALTKQYPEMSGINPNELTELRTLGEIVNHVAPKSGTISNNTTTNTPQVAVAAPIAKAVATSSSTPGMDNSKLEKILLEVVSEKTGYPAEMLELTMDMEADLGIDSIKRVEIFGALTKQYPEMSSINPNELTELRTLGEIVAYVGK